MPAAPPQGFASGGTSGSISDVVDTLNQIDNENNKKTAFTTTLMNENNDFLNNLLKQMELVTDEQNIDGGKLVDNN